MCHAGKCGFFGGVGWLVGCHDASNDLAAAAAAAAGAEDEDEEDDDGRKDFFPP